MEVSSLDPPLMAMDLSKSYNPLNCSHTEAMDLAKKPEWYHRRPSGCSTDVTPSFRSRVPASYSPPGAPIHCRDVEQGSETLGNYMNSTLSPGLDLFHDGVHSSLWHPGFYGTDQSSGPLPESSGGEESDSGSDVIFLVSSAKEPLLCGSFMQDGVGHMVEPLSPTMSSLDEGRGCYLLPEPMSSPSPDSSYSEDSSDSSVDVPVHHARPIVVSDISTIYGNPAESDVEISSEDSDVIEVSVTDKKKTSRCCRKSPPQSVKDKTPPREMRLSTRIRKSASEVPQFTCGVLRDRLKRRVKYDVVGIYNENSDSDDLMEFAVKFSSSEESVSQPVLPQRVSSHSDESDMDVQTKRKSPRDQQPHCKASYSKTNNHKQKKHLTVSKTKKLRKTKQKQRHRIPPQQQQKTSAPKSTAVKKKSARRRRKKHQHSGPSALFSPREPEILLKYVNAKERKKDKKLDSFCPFVHMEKRLCRVVNYQEEEATAQSSRGQQRASRTLSGFVPTTSCFQLSRSSSDSHGQSELLCCLCGQTANIMGLGDLHGPYCPAGSSVDGQTCRTEQKEDLHELSNGHLPNSFEDDCNADKSLLRSDSNCPTKVPLLLEECWIHEDCGIWAAGIFLVRGKLYGLEEAARLAQETICSACYQTGAIMGCFQKACSKNYHYTCAIHSGCILNEENFSMRCPEHKNKTFTTARQDKR